MATAEQVVERNITAFNAKDVEHLALLAGDETLPYLVTTPDLFRTQPGRGSWLADMFGRLAVRCPEVPVIFAGSRKFAEEWAYRFFGAAVADHTEST
jgi:hypothetical protein